MHWGLPVVAAAALLSIASNPPDEKSHSDSDRETVVGDPATRHGESMMVTVRDDDSLPDAESSGESMNDTGLTRGRNAKRLQLR